MKERGDVDVFRISWKLRNAFLRQHEQWDTEVRHRTKRLQINVIFPNSRPPKRAWLIEYMRRRTRPLPQEYVQQLPDNRWLVRWETAKPRLHEEYTLKWEW